MTITDQEVNRRVSAADYVLKAALAMQGASGVTLGFAGGWDTSDPDDLIQVLSLDAEEEGGRMKVSLHVRFDADGGVDEGYALDVATGSETDFAVGVDVFFLAGSAPLNNHRFGGAWGEHPLHPLTDWRYEVANGDTRRGYWEWVGARLDEARES